MSIHRKIDLADVDVGYEDLAKLLDELGADWEYFRDNGCQGLCSVEKTSNHTTTPRLAFDFPESQVMMNGEPTSKFGIYAGIYDGIKQTASSISDQLDNPNIEVLSVAVEENRITFVLGERSSVRA